MKQTAVEWLIKQITFSNEYGEIYYSYPDSKDLIMCIEQAKEMEKQQIIDAYSVGYITDFKLNSDYTTQTPEQYYNETFNNED